MLSHQATFYAKKASIYKNKPAFSIFGIGDYAFKPYKIAISGLYKTFHFTLVLPQYSKPIMLDDAFYFIGFDKIEFARYVLIRLNADPTTRFLQAITFSDVKRTFTKDILMRIDLLELANCIDKNYLEAALQKLNEKYNFGLTLSLWHNFIEKMKRVNNKQMELFV